MSESSPAAPIATTTATIPEVTSADLNSLINHLREAINKAFLIDQQRIGHTKVRAYKALLVVLYALMEDSGLSEEEIAMAFKTDLADLFADIDKH